MHPFELVAQPVRRRIIAVLASGEHTAGTLDEILGAEFGIGRSAVSHHLVILLKHGWVDYRQELTEHHYWLEEDVIDRLEAEVDALKTLWEARAGWAMQRDPPLPRRRRRPGPPPSHRGYRGRGVDPDDPWLHAELAESTALADGTVRTAPEVPR